MNKPESILTDAEMHALISGNPFTLGLSIARLKDFIRQVEKAAIAKLAEQEPFLWGSSKIDGHYVLNEIRATSNKWYRDNLDIPLYAHPMPSSSDVSNKPACVSKTGKSDTQTKERHRSTKNHIPDIGQMIECAKCGNPAIHHLIMDNLGYRNKTPLCGGCTQEHEHLAQDTNDHEIRNFGGAYGLVTYHYEPLGTAQPDHIPDAGKMVVPHGYRLVSLADIDTAIQRASVFDDGGDGADPESARSCIEILKSMISSKAVDSLEPKKEVVHDRHTGRELLYIPPVGESLYSMAQVRKESFSLALSVDTKEVQTLLQSYLDSLEGWQLMPKKLTDEMHRSAVNFIENAPDCMWIEYISSLYNTLLATAPKPTEVDK